MRKKRSFSLFFLLFIPTSLYSVPPPEGQSLSVDRICQTNPTAQSERVSQLKKAPFFQVPLSPTTAYVLVVRVDFSDSPMSKTKSQTEQFMANFKSFYLENSYGILTVSATVTDRGTGGSAGSEGCYRLPSSLASYAQGICSNYDGLAKDAVSAANTDYNFANAGAGQPFNHIMIYHSGIGAETASDSGCQTDQIWSVFAPTVPVSASVSDGIRTPFSADGVGFNGATFVPESEGQGIDPLGVICHEYGHQLGLPDLYKSASEPVVGKWSLMDSGVYLGSPRGSNPAHLDAWSKQFLGFFLNPQTIIASETLQRVTLDFALSSQNAFVRIPISNVGGVDSTKEYFLIERRGVNSKTGKSFDHDLPFNYSGEGILIWHIDDSIASNATRLASNDINNNSPHFGVDLVEANGGGTLATTTGKSSDPFPGSEGKSIFATPLSNAFSGAQSGITLTGFEGNQVLVKKAFATDSLEIAKVINFPNPGGPSYSQKSGAPAQTVTTIVLNSTRPTQNILLTIHDLSGILVREVPSYLIKANGSGITSYKFVYEYDWDGKNDSGDSCASGVYIYRFRADDSIVKTGKLLLIR